MYEQWNQASVVRLLYLWNTDSVVCNNKSMVPAFCTPCVWAQIMTHLDNWHVNAPSLDRERYSRSQAAREQTGYEELILEHDRLTWRGATSLVYFICRGSVTDSPSITVKQYSFVRLQCEWANVRVQYVTRSRNDLGSTHKEAHWCLFQLFHEIIFTAIYSFRKLVTGKWWQRWSIRSSRT